MALTATGNLPFFRITAELFCIFTAFGVFAFYWTVRRFGVQPLLVVLAAGYVCVGMVDLLHLLGHPDMAVFGGGPAAAAELWLLARGLEACVLLGAVALASRRVAEPVAFAVFALVFAARVPAILVWHSLPAVSAAGGPTALGVFLHVMIIAALVCACLVLLTSRTVADAGVRRLLLLVIGFSLLGVVLFGVLGHETGWREIAAQCARVLSYLLLFRAMLSLGLTRSLGGGSTMLGSGRGQLDAVLQQMPGGVVIVDASGSRVVTANEQAGEVLGEELTAGARVEDLILGRSFGLDGKPCRPSDWPLGVAMAGGEALTNEELEFLRSDGTRVHLLMSAAPIREEAGRVVAGVLTFQDISVRVEMREALSAAYRKLEDRVEARTRDLAEANEALQNEVEERRRAQQAAQEAGYFAENIVQTVREGLVVTRRESGEIVSANPAFCLMVGLSRSQVVGRRLDALGEGIGLPPETAARILMVVHSGEEFTGFETPFKLKGGEERWVALGGAPVRKERARGDEFLISFDDITQRKEAEKRILSYQEQLRSLARELTLAEERERQRIAGDLHDGIAQSLATVNLKLGLVMLDQEDEGSRQTLSEIREAVSAAIEETRTMSFDLSPVCLHVEGLDAAVNWFGEHVTEHYALPVQVESPNFHGVLDEDLEALLYRAVRELLLNVVKHAEASQARVSIGVQEGCILLEVQDDGRGFDTAELERTPLRLKGFGLFNVRERLRDLGGNMEIDSDPGRGTLVMVRVPWCGKKELEA